MSRSNEAPGAALRKQWNRLSGLPGGKSLFSWFVGRGAAYTGTIGARVDELSPGYARVELADRPKVRNHLQSIHAVALVNLGEMASGLAMLSGLPAGIGGIVVGLQAEYLKKARGRLVAISNPGVYEMEGSTSKDALAVETEIRDAQGDLVCRVTAQWLLRRKSAVSERGEA